MTNADFAAAHRRVLARRQLRDAAAASAKRAPLDPSSPLARLPQPLQNLVGSARAQWTAVSGREGTQPAFRVGQVDAELLDEELLELLRGQVADALKYFGPHIKDDWAPEISLILRALLFKLSIWDNSASYGAALQNLRYADARQTSLSPAPPQTWQKALHGLLSVGGRYAWEKWETYLLDSEGGYEEPSPLLRRLSSITSILSTTHTFAATASFLVFLVNGRYRTLLDRLLRLRLAPTTAQVSREVSFEYLNRQLVWHAFTEFLLFLLPLVGISRWRKWISRAWRRILRAVRRQPASDDSDARSAGELHFLPERTCAICYKDQNGSAAADGELASLTSGGGGVVGSSQTDVTNPYETIPCGCVYCFVCIAQRLEAEDGEPWTCLRCGEAVTECKPWSGDVLEEKSRSSSGKSVSFADEDTDTEQKDKGFARLEPMPLQDDEKMNAMATELEQRALNGSLDGWDFEDRADDVEGADEEVRDDEDEDEDAFMAGASLIQSVADEDEG